MKENNIVPEPALRRMPCYLAYVKMAIKEQQKYISSTQLARKMGIDPTQVSKDLSFTGIAGKTRVGYDVEQLNDVLQNFLGFNELNSAYLFGAGSLGNALLHDHGLANYGLKIAAAFDINPDIIGKKIADVPIYDFNDFVKVKKDNIKIGILAVPAEEAERVAEIMIDNGIKAIWNFTPIMLNTNKDVVIQDTLLYAHLAVMFNRMKKS